MPVICKWAVQQHIANRVQSSEYSLRANTACVAQAGIRKPDHCQSALGPEAIALPKSARAGTHMEADPGRRRPEDPEFHLISGSFPDARNPVAAASPRHAGRRLYSCEDAASAQSTNASRASSASPNKCTESNVCPLRSGWTILHSGLAGKLFSTFQPRWTEKGTAATY
ncbi:unnamed protein product [Symbiodinium sp. CCMP2456]|nr:unnamed protein product [Symbiodinium sp. CCMP2456]